jgi:hypothetical protein
MDGQQQQFHTRTTFLYDLDTQIVLEKTFLELRLR